MKKFENIANMTQEFQEYERAATGPDFRPVSPEYAAYWQARILLAIAQQLSVIAGQMKAQSEYLQAD